MALSRRAEALGEPSGPSAHYRCSLDPFDPVANPDGYINLGTAENHLVWDLVGARLASTPPLRADQVSYGWSFGSPALREGLAGLMARSARRAIDPEHLLVFAGASSALDMLCFSLLDPGEALLTPVPYHHAFDRDLVDRAGARLYPASGAQAMPTIAELDAAMEKAAAEQVRIKAIILISPHNPTGRVYPAGWLQAVIAWAAARDLDCIVDEIYAHSVFGETPYTSALSLRVPRPERLHVIYGFAKDFGLSGLKTGVVHTVDPALQRALQRLAPFSSVSTQTQATLAHLLADAGWLDGYLAENRRRLAAAHGRLSAGLASLGRSHLPGEAGLFAWVDFRDMLDRPDAAAEAALQQRIFEEARVSISAGTVFHQPEPGWFRVCFAWPEPTMRVAFERFQRMGLTRRELRHT